ncbi:MAG: class I SAM-dependent methyltransferase [Cyanobacteriota bacterium]
MQTINEYFRYVGMDSRPMQELDTCEVCNHHKFIVVRDTVLIKDKRRAPLRVCACTRCGFLSQLDRFDASFYDEYYAKNYRLCISDQLEPSDAFVENQIERGEHLYMNLASILPDSGVVLDVGSGPGGLLEIFHRHGWQVQGIDPDEGAIEFGRRHFGFNLKSQSAETMEIESNSLDLIVITGSLEHVTDPNRVLQLCFDGLRVNGLIVIEGWALAQAQLLGGFGHNQKRYLTTKSISHLLIKHGFVMVRTFDFPICGPTRPHSICGIGRKKQGARYMANEDWPETMDFDHNQLMQRLDDLNIL